MEILVQQWIVKSNNKVLYFILKWYKNIKNNWKLMKWKKKDNINFIVAIELNGRMNNIYYFWKDLINFLKILLIIKRLLNL